MELISCPELAAAAGHYSHAVAANGLLFVSGQLPVRPDGSMPDGIEDQVRQTLSNVEAILAGAGSGLRRIVSATVYVSSIALWPEVNRVYASILGSHKPARTVAVSPELHHGALVEIQVVALA